MSDEIIGLDLGTSSIKAVSLKKAGKSFQLRGINIAVNPIGRLISENNQEQQKLVSQILSVVKSLQPESNKVRVGLAESQVFTRVISVPVLSEAELASAIRWEAEQHIPIPLAEVQLDYLVLSRPQKGVKEGNMEVLLVAARQDTVGKLVDLMEQVGLEVIGIEPGLLAAARSLNLAADAAVLLANIGASSTDFAVLSEKHLALTYSIPTGGVALTRAIEVEFGLGILQAEEYKRAYGLDEKMLQGKVRNAIISIFRSIISEAKKAINAFESVKKGKKIDSVVLTGGGSLLPAIAGQVAIELGVSEVNLANPFSNLNVKPGIKFPLESPVYTVAVGLAEGVV